MIGIDVVATPGLAVFRRRDRVNVDQARTMLFSDLDVHRVVRHRPDGGLDRAVDGDGRGPDAAHRPAASALYWSGRTRLRADKRPVGGPSGPTGVAAKAAPTIRSHNPLSRLI